MPIDLTPTDDTQLGVIDGVESQFNWLSNFHLSPLTWDGHTFATAEAAFAAGNTLDPALRAQIAAEESPLKAKQLGRRLALRLQWDERYRHIVMGEVLEAKFAEPGLRGKLTATGDRLLIERNDWHDDFWGDCSCPRHRTKLGRNMLGLALMQLRSRLAGTAEDHWPRVALTVIATSRHSVGNGRSPNSRTSPRNFVTVTARGSRSPAGPGDRTCAGQTPPPTRAWPCGSINPFRSSPTAGPRNGSSITNESRPRGPRRRARIVVPHQPALRPQHWMIRDSNALVAVVDPQHRGGGTHAAVTSALYNPPVIRIDIRARDTRIIMPR